MRPPRSLVHSLGDVKSLLMVKRYSLRLSAAETHNNAMESARRAPIETAEGDG
jgi:hypothetical protein